MNNNDTRVRLFRFFSWVARPRGVSNLKMILRRLTDDDLVGLMERHADSPAAAKIAWAEFGRRHGFANIDFEMREVNVLEVQTRDLVLASGLGAVA
jgi:hypothetical protein